MSGVQQQDKDKKIELQRRELVWRFSKLLEELESQPVRRQSTSGFPFNVLERLISWMLTTLEQWVDRLVTAALERFEKYRKR